MVAIARLMNSTKRVRNVRCAIVGRQSSPGTGDSCGHARRELLGDKNVSREKLKTRILHRVIIIVTVTVVSYGVVAVPLLKQTLFADVLSAVLSANPFPARTRCTSRIAESTAAAYQWTTRRRRRS